MKKPKYDTSKQTTLDLPRTVNVRLEKVSNGQHAFGQFEVSGAVDRPTLEYSARVCGYRVIDWNYDD